MEKIKMNSRIKKKNPTFYYLKLNLINFFLNVVIFFLLWFQCPLSQSAKKKQNAQKIQNNLFIISWKKHYEIQAVYMNFLLE